MSASTRPSKLQPHSPRCGRGSGCTSRRCGSPAPSRQRYGLDPDLVEFADCFPDLLWARPADGRAELVVVDAKASDMMKLSHRIQVALYTVLLEQFLIDTGLDSRLQVAGEGAVWLYRQPEPEPFPLNRIRPALEHFLRHELTPILTGPASEVFWHLYYRCEWCDYYAHCRGQAEESSDVSLIPYLSTYAKRHLRERGVSSVTELAQALTREDAPRLLAGNASLEGRRSQLLQAARSILDGTIGHTGAAHCGMPRGEHIRIVLTLQEDPLSGQVYGWAVNRIGGKAALGTASSTQAHAATNVEELPAVRHRLIAALHGLLQPVHDYNKPREWRDQLSVQLYVFDTYERDLLVQLLLASIDDDNCREQAIRLLFHVQQPELTLADEHPAQEVIYPLIVLTEVTRSLFALPIPVVYRFADVVAALQPSAYGFTYHYDDLWDFHLSNRLKANALLVAWNGGRPDMIEAIERRLKIRVWAANSVINGIRERLDGTGALFAWPPKFAFPEDMDLADPLLSRLAFLVRYESVLGSLETANRRARPEEQRLADGDTLRLRSLGDGWFGLDADQHGLELVEDDWPHYLLTRDNDAGRRARQTFNDFRWRQAMWPPKHLPAAYAAITAVDTSRQRLRLEVNGHKDAWTPVQPGEWFHLDTRFIDITSPRLLTEIVAESQDGGRRFTDLLRSPSAAHRALPPDSITARARALAAPHMTPSQRMRSTRCSAATPRWSGGRQGPERHTSWPWRFSRSPPPTSTTAALCVPLLSASPTPP